MYEIKRGGHADMKRIYPMMEFDFKDWERPSLADCHLGLIRGAELLLLKDESGLEAGYAYMLRDAARRYALLGWLAVYPTIRGAGTGAQKPEGKEKEICDDQRGDDRRNAKGGDGAAHRLPPLCACLRTHGRQPRQPSRERA